MNQSDSNDFQKDLSALEEWENNHGGVSLLPDRFVAITKIAAQESEALDDVASTCFLHLRCYS
jgi:hypothetical protein